MAKKPEYNYKSLQTEYGKMPPQAVDLEEAILGSLMLEKDAFITVSDFLKPECFYKEAHQKIYRGIQNLSLNNEPVDILTVSEEMKRLGELEEIGGYYYLAQLTSKVASAAHIEFHARIVVQKYIQRELIRVCTDIQNKAYDEATDVADLVDMAQKQVFEIAEGNIKKETTAINALIDEAIKGIEIAGKRADGLSGVPSGFNALDEVTSGWQPSDLVIIAADISRIFVRTDLPVYQDSRDTGTVGLNRNGSDRFRFVGGDNQQIDLPFYQAAYLLHLQQTAVRSILDQQGDTRIFGGLHLHIQQHRLAPGTLKCTLRDANNILLLLRICFAGKTECQK